MKFNIISHAFVGQAGTGYTGHINDTLYGGAEVYLYNLAEYLLLKGHEVTVIQKGTNNNIYYLDDIKVKEIKIPDLSILQIVGITERFHLYNLFWKKHLDNDVDKIHFHYFYNAYPFADKSMTGTCHGIEWDCPNKSINYKIFSKSLRWIAKKSIKKLEKIAANDYYFIKYVQSEIPQYRHKVYYIPNYVDTTIFNPYVGYDEYLKKDNSKIRILLPKNPSIERGTGLAIDAISQLVNKHENIELLIAGESNMSEYYRDYSKKIGVEKHIKFIGHKNHFFEMPKIYNTVDIVIIPSICREATSLAALESMASKKPTIVTDTGGLTDIVIDSFTGKVIRPKSEEVASAIHELINDSDLRKKIANNGMKWVKDRFNKDLWCKRYLEFFEI